MLTTVRFCASHLSGPQFDDHHQNTTTTICATNICRHPYPVGCLLCEIQERTTVNGLMNQKHRAQKPTMADTQYGHFDYMISLNVL